MGPEGSEALAVPSGLGPGVLSADRTPTVKTIYFTSAPGYAIIAYR